MYRRQNMLLIQFPSSAGMKVFALPVFFHFYSRPINEHICFFLIKIKTAQASVETCEVAREVRRSEVGKSFDDVRRNKKTGSVSKNNN